MSFPVAFLAGLAAFFSPCVLPLLPVYLAFLGGGEHSSSRKLLFNLLLFSLGFALVFSLLGAGATTIGQLLARHQLVLTRIAGVILLVFGLQMLGLFRLPLLQRRIGFNIEPQRTPVGYFLFGLVLASAWTPCIGSMLLSILLLAGSLETVWQGTSLLFVFSLGFAAPFVVTGLLVGPRPYKGLSPKLALVVQRIAAVVLAGVGLLLLFNRWHWLENFFFSLSNLIKCGG